MDNIPNGNLRNLWYRPETMRPNLGEKVLVERQVGGEIDYDVAIYAISENDKRKHGFFINSNSYLKLPEYVMSRQALQFYNITAWTPIIPSKFKTKV